MADAPRTHDSQAPAKPQIATLAELLFPLDDADRRAELERFRIAFERKYGETDMTRYYTSMRPLAEQEWLLAQMPKRYFDGLPPFAKAYLKSKMDLAAAEGKLDDTPNCFLTLYARGHMRLAESTEH
jgi:hypothetical protein